MMPKAVVDFTSSNDMTRRDFLATSALTPVFLAAAQSGAEPGFVRLFDGKSLDGWVVADGPESA
jgi:hypothetical protein